MKLPGNKTAIAFVVTVSIFVSGCVMHCYSHMDAPPRPEALEHFRVFFADAPVTIEVLDFAVNSVKSDAENVTADAIKTNYSLAVPNALYRSLGNRHVFSEVFRASHAGQTADFIVSGSYDYVFRSKRSVASYFMYPAMFTIYVKGTTHLKVTASKSGEVIFEKTYVEEHADKGENENLSVHLLHPADIEAMTFDIKKAIYSKTGKNL